VTLQALITQTLAADRPVWLVGFDPGRDKCGVAIVCLTPRAQTAMELTLETTLTATLTATLTVQHRAVIPSGEAIAYLQTQIETPNQSQPPISGVIMGDGTTSKQWLAQLQTLRSAGAADPADSAAVTSAAMRIERINEYNSTQEARDRYWQLYPPQGLARLVPAALRTIERPIDDIVAVILVERFVAQFLSIVP